MSLSDARIQYIAQRISLTFSVSQEEVLEQFDKEIQNLMSFFTSKVTKIIAFQVKNNQVSLYGNFSQLKNQVTMFFIKVKQGPLPDKRFEDDLCVQMITDNVVESLQYSLDYIWKNIIDISMEDQQILEQIMNNWNTIFQQVELTLRAIISIESTQVILYELFDNLVNNSLKFEKMIKDEPQLIYEIENQFSALTAELSKTLLTINKLRIYDYSSGPESELQYWKIRTAVVENVLKQLSEQKWVEPGKIILRDNNMGQQLQRFSEVILEFEQEYKESSNNAKFVQKVADTMRVFINSDPQNMSQNVDQLLACIENVVELSDFYNSGEHITSLMVKIVNKIISQCKLFIISSCNVKNLFDANISIFGLILNKVQTLNCTIQQKFKVFKTKAIQLHDHRLTIKQQSLGQMMLTDEFIISESNIFQQFDLFVHRLEDVHFVIISRNNFSSIYDCTLQGLELFAPQQTELINNLRSKTYDFLDFRNITFESDIEIYKNGIQNIEQLITQYIQQELTKNYSVDQYINIANQLYLVLNRKNLVQSVLQIYEMIIHKYYQLLKQTEKFYQENIENKEVLQQDVPESVARVLWVRFLHEKILKPMNFIKQVYIYENFENELERESILEQCNQVFGNYINVSSIPPNVIPLLFKHQKIGLRITSTLKRLKGQFRQQENTIVQQFLSNCQLIKSYLSQPILKMKETKIIVNFNSLIFDTLRSAASFQHYNYEIPQYINLLLQNENNLKSTKSALQNEVDLFVELHCSVKTIMRPLLQPLFNKVIKRIHPGFETISWSSVNLLQFIDSFKQYRNDLQILVIQINSLYEQHIDGNLQQILRIKALPLSPRPKFYLESLPDTITLNQKFDQYLTINSHPMLFDYCLERTEKLCQETIMKLTTYSLQIAHTAVLIVRTIGTQYFEDARSQSARDISDVVCQAIKAVFSANDTARQYANLLQPIQKQLYDKIVSFMQYVKQQTYSAFLAAALTILQSFNRAMSYNVQKQCVQYNETEHDTMFGVNFVYQGSIIHQPSLDKISLGCQQIRQYILHIFKHIPLWNSTTLFNGYIITQILPIYEANSLNTILSEMEQSTRLGEQLVNNFKEEFENIKVKFNAIEPQFREEKKKIQETTKSIKSKRSTTSTQFKFSETKLAVDINEMDVNSSIFTIIGKSKLVFVQLASIESRVLLLPHVISKLIKHIQQFDVYLTQNSKLIIEGFEFTKPGFYQYKEKIEQLQDHYMSVTSIPTFYQTSTMRFSFEILKNDIIIEINELKQKYFASLACLSLKNVISLKEELQRIDKGLKIPIDSLNNIRLSMIAQNDLREFESLYEMKMVPIINILYYLEHQQYKIADQLKESEEDVKRYLLLLRQKSSELKVVLVQIQPQKLKELHEFIIIFQQKLEDYVKEYVLKGPMVKGISPTEAANRVEIFKQRFDSIERDYGICKSGEELFGLDETPYPDLMKLRKEFVFLEKLYGLYNNVLTTIDGYAKTSWPDLDFNNIEIRMQEYNSQCATLPKAMKNWQAFLDLKQKIDDFQAILPLFIMMSNKAITERHWVEVSKTVNAPQLLQVLQEPANFKLQIILDTNWLLKFEDIEDIASGAAREAEVEAKFKDLKSVWNNKNITLAEFKSRGFIVLDLKATAELISELEEGNMQIQSLRANKYNKPFKVEIEKFARDISLFDERLKQWIQVQQNWSYLEAVFQSGDIARQLPTEARNFNQIDKNWIRIMSTAYQNTNCLHITVIDDTLQSLLPSLEISLEQCQKQLSGYLETKRLLFPRFSFVSDTVLLEILGNQSDPNALQPYFSQIFEALYSVTFDKVKRTLIKSISDRGKETIELSNQVQAQGPVEEWLTTLIIAMQKEIKMLLKSSVGEINVILTNIPNMCDQYPGQICLLLLQIYWTQIVEHGLKGIRQSPKAMEQAKKKIQNLTEQLLELTRQPLSKQRRTSVETLITIHVHQQEVFDSLVKQNVKSLFDFEWLKQSRFYWNQEKDDCFVQITDINFSYSYEYLGINERLVITPLTDRCYITLAQAIGMVLGGSPAGPAGTGKTETCKDLGKAVGQFCVVFNCSDQMDFRGLGRIFRGIAQGGIYGDFDEFNRIDLSVMSVAAQQISCIFDGLRRKQKSIVYTDGTQVTIKNNCAYFITMNPGYAGRVELLENLKALFRSVAMISLNMATS